jgi:hypothetical protein
MACRSSASLLGSSSMAFHFAVECGRVRWLNGIVRFQFDRATVGSMIVDHELRPIPFRGERA